MQWRTFVERMPVWWRGLNDPGGRASLFAAAILADVLLALVGQVYQTGADTF